MDMWVLNPWNQYNIFNINNTVKSTIMLALHWMRMHLLEKWSKWKTNLQASTIKTPKDGYHAQEKIKRNFATPPPIKLLITPCLRSRCLRKEGKKEGRLSFLHISAGPFSDTNARRSTTQQDWVNRLTSSNTCHQINHIKERSLHFWIFCYIRTWHVFTHRQTTHSITHPSSLLRTRVRSLLKTNFQFGAIRFCSEGTINLISLSATVFSLVIPQFLLIQNRAKNVANLELTGIQKVWGGGLDEFKCMYF